MTELKAKWDASSFNTRWRVFFKCSFYWAIKYRHFYYIPATIRAFINTKKYKTWLGQQVGYLDWCFPWGHRFTGWDKNSYKGSPYENIEFRTCLECRKVEQRDI